VNVIREIIIYNSPIVTIVAQKSGGLIDRTLDLSTRSISEVAQNGGRKNFQKNAIVVAIVASESGRAQSTSHVRPCSHRAASGVDVERFSTKAIPLPPKTFSVWSEIDSKSTRMTDERSRLFNVYYYYHSQLV
jgi:hypothetical protein